MSREYEYRYALERQRRREMYEARVRKTTEQFYHRYSDTYEILLSEGLMLYIPEEMQRLSEDLSSLGQLLITDPTQARELSFAIGDYINTLRRRAADVREKEAMERRIKERETEQEIIACAMRADARRADALKEYFSVVGGISDRQTAVFAADRLEALRADIENGTVVTDISARIFEIVSEAEQQAEEWRRSEAEKSRNAALESIESVGADILAQKFEDGDTHQKLCQRVRELKELAAQSRVSAKEVHRQLAEINEEFDDAVITEETRREAVRGVIRQLRSQEFTVEAPELITEGDTNYVLIRAHRPSGKRAECRLDLHGNFTYKFDRYEGLTCLKDIEKFNVDLDRIYSIKLSDERVLWSNPDRMSADFRNTPDAKGAKK